MNKHQYFVYICRVADQIYASYHQRYQKAVSKAEETGNNNQISYLVYYANIESLRFQRLKDETFARRAKKALLDVGSYADRAGLEGAVMDELFAPAIYLNAYRRISGFEEFTDEEKRQIEKYAANTLQYCLDFPEWGAHNRAAARAYNLLMGTVCFPDNPKADIWRKLSHTLIEDSRDRWSIEDAGTYFPIWFNTLIHYAEETKDTDFFQHPVTQYYFRYLRELISPMGVIPDYGDGRWGSCWGLLLSCLEAGAAAYQDGEMKAAAHRLFHAMSALDNGLSVLSLKGIHGLVDSCLWADDGVMEIQKERESREVLEDVVGKKIIFEKNGNYLLTNYRDEGRFAWLQRNYLRNTIPVEPEKAHHGHSDENSIVCLISNGCVLLHDGGYRDCISEKRAYRSDYYHNRVILRNGCPKEGVGFLEYVEDNGVYLPVETEKIYFQRFKLADVSRVRLYDTVHRLNWDRCITYIKKNNIYLVVDIVQAQEAGYYTFGAQYFTRLSEKLTDGFFRTKIDYLGSDEFLTKIPNNTSSTLLIGFPGRDMPVGSAQMKRSYTTETSLHQWFAGRMERGECRTIVSLLIPDDGTRDIGELENCCAIQKNSGGVSVLITMGRQRSRFAFQYDKNLGIYSVDKRPRYHPSFNSVCYGELTTDAMFCCVTEDDSFAFVCGSVVSNGGKTLFHAKEADFLNNRFEKDRGFSWWRNWEADGVR